MNLRHLLPILASLVIPLPAAASPSPEQWRLSPLHVSTERLTLSSKISHTNVRVIAVDRTPKRLGTLRPAAELPLYVTCVADGKLRNFSNRRFPAPATVAGEASLLLRWILASGATTWQIFDGPISPMEAVPGRNGSIWVLFWNRDAVPKPATLVHVTRDGKPSFFNPPTSISGRFAIASDRSGNLWLFDNEPAFRLIRIDARGDVFSAARLPSSITANLGLEFNEVGSNAFWLSDRLNHLIAVPTDGSDVRAIALQPAALAGRPQEAGPLSMLFGKEKPRAMFTAGNAKGAWIYHDGPEDHEHQWYGVDGTVLDVADFGFMSNPRTLPSGHLLYQDLGGGRPDASQVVELDNGGHALVSTVRLSLRNVQSHGIDRFDISGHGIDRTNDGTTIFAWSPAVIASIDDHRRLRLLQVAPLQP